MLQTFGFADSIYEGSKAMDDMPLNTDILLDELCRALESDDVQRRYDAMNRFIQSGVRVDHRFLTPLHMAMNDMRFLAIIALGQVDDPAAFDLIAQLFNQDEDSTDRYAAGRALGSLHTDAAIDMLIHTLRDPIQTRRIAAAEALWWYGDERAIEPLLNVLQDPMVITYAILALGRIRAQAAVVPLLALLEDPPFADTILQSYVVRTLGEIGDPQALEPLVRILRQQHDASYAAAEALGHLGDARAVEPLMEVLAGPNRSLAAWAAEALGRLRDPRVLPALLHAMHDPCDWVRVAAEKDLAILATNELSPPWSGLLNTMKGQMMRLGSRFATQRSNPYIKSANLSC